MDDMFRYVAIRNPRRLRSRNTQVPIDVKEDQRSDFYKALQGLLERGAADGVVASAAKDYQKTKDFEEPLVGAFKTVFEVENLAGRRAIRGPDFLGVAVKAFGLEGANPPKEIRELLDGADGVSTSRRLVDAILSLNYAPSTKHVPDDLVRAFKILHLLRSAVDDRWPFQAGRPLPTLLERLVPTLPSTIKAKPVPPRGSGEVGRSEPAAQPDKRIVMLGDALDELTKPGLLRRTVTAPSNLGSIRTAPRGTGFGSLPFLGGGGVGRGLSLASGTIRAPRAYLAGEAYDDLTLDTKEVLAELGFGRENTDLVLAQRTVEAELAAAFSKSPASRRYSVMVGNMRIGVSGPQPQIAPPGRTVLDPSTLLSLVSPYYGGQGELRIVRQELIAYEIADVAHVENVLSGESKRRRHRTLDRTEEFERELLDETTEAERDLQSTNRHELEVEAQRVVTQDVRVEGGLQVSGSYGPSVTFTANAGAGFTYHTEQSERRAARFAQEVVERTVERIKSRTLRERRVVRVRQVEELNSHGINNARAGASHVRGVYRWLNKIYRAQIYSYGMRHMFDFMVPEPAAYYLWALAQPQTSATSARSLEKPEFGPDHITRCNWHTYAADYGAQGVQPPPPEVVYVAYTTSGTGPGNHVATDRVKITDGYEAVVSFCSVNFTTPRGVPEDGGWWLAIHDGGASDTAIPYLGPIGFSAVDSGEVPIAYRDWGLSTFVVTVNIACLITLSHFQKWQLDTYSAIMDAYQAYEREEQARAAQAEIGRGINIPGRNPAENLRIIAGELQRSCLSLLTKRDLDDLSGFNATAENEFRNWRMNPAAALALGSEVRFFQQAFEWENMSYVFYPYFWGRSDARWIETLHQFSDNDPVFASFIKAGMARVQVPVRPGFEAALARYCQDTTLWNGSDTPLIGDDLYVAIIDEIKEQLDAPDGGQPVGPPWEVRVPTALVLLEDAANLRGFRDPVFGDANGISAIVFVPPA